MPIVKSVPELIHILMTEGYEYKRGCFQKEEKHTFISDMWEYCGEENSRFGWEPEWLNLTTIEDFLEVVPGAGTFKIDFPEELLQAAMEKVARHCDKKLIYAYYEGVLTIESMQLIRAHRV